jgi:hypothetical protein
MRYQFRPRARMRRDGYDSFMSKRPSAEGEDETGGAAEAIDVTLRAARLCPSGYAVPLVSGVLLVRKIVDVFVRDTLKGSYPVIVECQGRPAEDEFIDQVRNGMDRGFYSADDIKVAKFVVREAGGR